VAWKSSYYEQLGRFLAQWRLCRVCRTSCLSIALDSRFFFNRSLRWQYRFDLSYECIGGKFQHLCKHSPCAIWWQSWQYRFSCAFRKRLLVALIHRVRSSRLQFNGRFCNFLHWRKKLIEH
jgi:hypothetical protein